MLQYPSYTQVKVENLKARRNNEEEQECENEYQEEDYAGEDQCAEYEDNQEAEEEQLRARPMMTVSMRLLSQQSDMPLFLGQLQQLGQ